MVWWYYLCLPSGPFQRRLRTRSLSCSSLVCMLSTSPRPQKGLLLFYHFLVSAFSEILERTAALSKITGWSTLGASRDICPFPALNFLFCLGGALSFSLGGWITAQVNNLTGVYIISIAVHTLTCIYILTILPESFPLTKREELRRQREEEARSTPLHGWVRNILSLLAIVFEPLKQLKPTYNPSTGKRNWRLVYCAIHIFIVTVADGYAALAMVVYFASRYQYTPAEVRLCPSCTVVLVWFTSHDFCGFVLDWIRFNNTVCNKRDRTDLRRTRHRASSSTFL